MSICVHVCVLCWVYYYVMPNLHLFSSQLQLTMRLPFLLRSPLLPLSVCFLVSPSFPLLSVHDQSLVPSVEDICTIPESVYFECYNRPSYLTYYTIIRFLSLINSVGLLTWHCIKHVKRVLNHTTHQCCCILVIFYPVLVKRCSPRTIPKALCTWGL